MPHTSHRKKKQDSKRIQVIDESGWTRVTTTNSLQRKPRPLPAQKALEDRLDGTETEYPKWTVPEGKTVEQVEQQYQTIEKRWLESDSWRALDKCLKEEVDEEILKQVDKCLLFGSGSFSGVIQGWFDRSHVAMYQLAAFLNTVKTIESVSGRKPTVFAQDPIYTSLDTEFLSRLGVVTVADPAGFKEITIASFVYTPNAELCVTLRTLTYNSAVYLTHGGLDMYWRNEKGEACTHAIHVNVESGGFEAEVDDAEAIQSEDGAVPFDRTKFKPLHECTASEQEIVPRAKELKDEIEEGQTICEDFKKDKDVRLLPSLDARDEPFYKAHLYYRRVEQMSGRR